MKTHRAKHYRKQGKQLNKRLKTNLYNLVEAVYDAISPGEEALVPVAVTNLIRDHRGKFIDKYRLNP